MCKAGSDRYDLALEPFMDHRVELLEQSAQTQEGDLVGPGRVLVGDGGIAGGLGQPFGSLELGRAQVLQQRPFYPNPSIRPERPPNGTLALRLLDSPVL